MEECLRQLHPECEQLLPRGVDGREKRVAGGTEAGGVARVVSGLLELPERLLGAERVGGEFGEETLTLGRRDTFEQLIVTILARAWGQGHAELAGPLNQVIQLPQALSAALRKIHRKAPQVEEGPRAGVFLPELIAEGQRDVLKGGCCILAREVEMKPGQGFPAQLSDQLAW